MDEMESFCNTMILRTERPGGDVSQVLSFQDGAGGSGKITRAIEQNRLVLIQRTSFHRAAATFGELVDHYGLRKSYELQMQYVVTRMKARDGIDNVAVTVNKRAPYQIIQPHSEGDSTSPLDLFGLYCVRGAEIGGENVLSLVS